MKIKIIYRPFEPGDEYQVHDLVKILFEQFIAGSCQPEGVKSFMQVIEPHMISQRNLNDNFMYVAARDKRVIAAIEIRDHSHIMLFYVESIYHKQGIGRQLFALAKKECQKIAANMPRITVNSSLYAIQAYERLGFIRLDDPQMIDGIGFVPMAYYL